MLSRRVFPATRPEAAVLLAFVVALLLAAGVARATPISLNASYAGNINFTGTAATLRTQPDSGNPCAVGASATASLTGIPAGSTIRRALLYWAGSGINPDNNVTLDGTNVTAARTYTEQRAGSDRWYFQGVADVTSAVNAKRNGNYTLTNLTVVTTDAEAGNGTPGYCSISAVLAGFGIIVIYEQGSEPLRVINLYEGLQQFQGNSLTLTPSNFLIPASPINGKLAVFSWEGDVAGGALNGFNETIRYNGTTLTTGINPLNDQYNSTVTYTGSTTQYGVDLDEYDISPYLAAGQTSGTTFYSSGQDLVLLGLQAVSVTSVPVSDMAISKSLVQDALYRTNTASWRIQVSNNGPGDTALPVTVSDTIPAGLTYAGYSSSDPNWSCNAPPAATVTCTNSGILASGATYADLFINTTVAAGATLGSTITNTATVSGGNTFDHISANNSSSAGGTVADATLAGSTKSVTDLNGGDLSPGDVLRYEIELVTGNAGAANGIQVVDNLPANVGSFSLVSIPPGASSTFLAPPGGTNGTGRLTVTGINLAGNSSASIVFDVTVNTGAAIGAPVNNTANITPAAPLAAFNRSANLTVLAASVPVTNVTKNLYTYFTGQANVFDTVDTAVQIAGANRLSRRVPTAVSTATQIPGLNGSVTLNLTPALARALQVNTAQIPVVLCMRRSNNGATSSNNRTVSVTLSRVTGGVPTTIGTATTGTFNSTTWTHYTLNIPAPGSLVNLAAGDSLRLVITNTSTTQASRTVDVTTNNATCNTSGTYSRVELPVNTAINVDSVAAYSNVAFPGGTLLSWTIQGTTVRARAVVSDPFGGFDIASASLRLFNGSGGLISGPTAMTRVASTPASGERTFELSFTPASYTLSPYTLRVDAVEGTEGSITDFGLAGLVVRPFPPVLTVVKSASGGGTASPGDELTYTVVVTNTGTGDATAVQLDDRLPRLAAFKINGYGSGDPFDFVPGSSGLTEGTASYSLDGSNYSYTLNPGAGGAPPDYDGDVRYFRLPLSGSMPPGGSFTLRYKARVD